MSLRALPARRIIASIADAAARWADADFPPRVRVLDGICVRTGYSLPVVEFALDALFGSLREDAIASAIAAELGSLDALDTFVPRGNAVRAHAIGVERVAIVSSRTTIGVAIAPAVFALCAKCDVLVKDRDDALVSAFFATLREEHDAFASAASAQAWSGSDGSVDLRSFDAVVAFGNDATLNTIAHSLDARTRFIPYGSAASIGYVAREMLADESSAREIAVGAARDLVLYDSEGCMSLHALFVEEGGGVSPRAFGELFAREVERACIEFPPLQHAADRGARLLSERNLAAFRAVNGSSAVFSDSAEQYLAVLDPPRSEPPAFLPRAIALHTVDSPDDAVSYLRKHHLIVEALALAGERPDLMRLVQGAGVHRVTHFGELQRPPIGEHHGGRARIADFVRWIDDER